MADPPPSPRQSQGPTALHALAHHWPQVVEYLPPAALASLRLVCTDAALAEACDAELQRARDARQEAMHLVAAAVAIRDAASVGELMEDGASMEFADTRALSLNWGVDGEMRDLLGGWYQAFGTDHQTSYVQCEIEMQGYSARLVAFKVFDEGTGWLAFYACFALPPEQLVLVLENEPAPPPSEVISHETRRLAYALHSLCRWWRL